MDPSAPGAEDLAGVLIQEGALGLDVMALDGRVPVVDASGQGVVRVGVHRSRALPAAGLEAFDILLSTDPAAPSPWVGLAPDRLDAALADIAAVVERQPVAATVAAQVFRLTLALDFDQALVLESLAYSMLLASAGFKTWRAGRPVRIRPDDDAPRVRLERKDGVLSIRLTRAGARNAVDARMRDELVEALDFALIDPDQAPVVLSAEGPHFSAGGDLDTFGQADDPGLAHAIRVLRSATGLAHRLGERLTARVHGAGVGAGVETPAAAHRVISTPDASFRLPEVSMGLIPGAGGTASIPRRIGRQRACYLAISGHILDAETALAWGLIDAIEAAP